MSSLILPALLCEIEGENLMLVLHYVHDQDDRVFIWNWSSDVLKVVSNRVVRQKSLLTSYYQAFTVPY